MEAYLQVFVNFEQNDRAKLFLMDEFAYNNIKNASTIYISWELYCGYHFCIFYKENIDFCSKSKLANNLTSKLREFMAVY